jgi:two-component system phosphate regulon sensor histidine kinase PhoR
MTLRSPIFRKLLASAFFLIGVTLLVLDFYLTRYTAHHQTETTQQRLEAQARILEGELAAVPAGELSAWAREAGTRAGTRVTLISPEGVVLGDSQHDPETMENHAGRPEVRQALASGVGKAIRHSATLGRDLCYVALAVELGGRPGHVLRLAVPLEDLDAAISELRWRIFGASLVAAFLAMVIAYFFSRSFTQRIGRLQAFAEGLVDERVSGSPLPTGNDEIGALARSLNRMAVQLRELVERLSVESARLEAILASMVEGVLAVDENLNVTFCNDSFARVVGAAIPVPVKLPLLELVRDAELQDMLRRVLQTGESLRQRLQLPAAEGRTFEVQAAPLATASRRGAIAILHDITELERLERIRKDFVANVSHELRTPLTAIRGYAETLLEGAMEDGENRPRFLEIIKAHAIRLNNIASDLLVLSEIESGGPAAEPERVSVRAALEAALRAVESEARVRGVNVICEHGEDLAVMGGKVRLEQALINLLDNAVKFNRPGGEVRVRAALRGEDTVRIAITDNGIGIPSEHTSRIFERFYRVDKARSREVGGTGLGLSIVKHVVERMNGTVEVESQLGKGSTFIVYLPACR